MFCVSLITPSLNQARFLRQTIESVLAQQGPFDLEYRVMDGGSTDGSLEILEEHRDRLTYVSQPDRGQVEALNRGLALSTGEIVGWLNSDDVLLPGALGWMVEAFEAHPEVEWVHGRCLIVDETGREIQAWISRYKNMRARHYSWRRLLLENFISQPTVFWRRGVGAELGPLDDTLPLAFDYDFWLRLARRGKPFYIEEPVAAFRRHSLSKTGVGYPEMFRQEYRVACRYAGNQTGLLRAKRWRMAAFSAIYRGLGWIRRG